MLTACQPESEESEEENEEKQANKYAELTMDDWNVETVSTNLHVPWDINIFENEILLTEREGHIVLISDNDTVRKEVSTSDPIVHQGEGGLLGMTLTENFGESREVILYYTYEGRNGLANKLVKAVEDENEWRETEILLDEIPGDGIHNGGRVAIGPDVNLYITVGDANVPELSQDKKTLEGTILRMTLDGEVPGDNPFENSFVYSYGHRNPQGLAWNEVGELYSSEHGPTGHDEINKIKPGLNYGWPEIIGDEEEEDMQSPLVHSADDTWAPSGITFFDGHLFITGLRGQSLYVMDEENMELVEVFTGEGRIRDVTVANNSLYIITNNTDGRGSPDDEDDRLLRLSLSDD